jgi:hypothetical protein
MGDFIDATQSYVIEDTGTTITEITNNDLLTISTTSDANALIRLVNNSATNTKNLYILQANPNGEIRFLTAGASANNDVGTAQPYNVKIGADGKLYVYWTYNFLTNPLRFSGWYDIADDVASQGNQLSLLEIGSIALETQITIANTNISILDTTLSGFITTQNGINAAVNTTLNEHTAEIGALATQTAVIPTLQSFFTGSSFVGGTRVGISGLWRRTNWRDAQTLLAQRYTSRVVQGRVGSVMVGERTLTAPTLNAFQLVSNTTGVAMSRAVGDISTAFGIVGGGVVLAGIYRYYTNAQEEQRNDLIKDLIETKEDMILQQANTPNAFYTTKNRIQKAGLVIDATTDNAYAGAVGFYEVEGLTQYAGVVLNMEIYLDTGVKKARIVNVVSGGNRVWVVGDQIQIPKSTKLGGYAGGGGGDLLKINVSTIYNPLEVVDTQINDLLTEQTEEDRRDRRRKGVIGTSEYDATTLTTASATETNTITGEVITYNTLKSRLNLLPTGTSDVDVYTSTGKIGIGTTPTKTLHTYHATDNILRLGTATNGTASIEFVKGTDLDVNSDWRLKLDNVMKLQYQNSTLAFGDTGTDLMWNSTTQTTFFKPVEFQNKVGIGTGVPTTHFLDVFGDINIKSGAKYKINNADLALTDLTGTLAVNKGGTGATTFTANGLIVGNGTTALTQPTGLTFSGTTLNAPIMNVASGGKYKINNVDLSYNDLTNKLTPLAGGGITINAQNEISSSAGTAYTGGNGITITGASIAVSGTITQLITTGSIDMLTLQNNATNSLRVKQNFLGTNDFTYNLIQKNNNVDYPAFTFKNGQVAVGTTNVPTYALDVAGDINITGEIRKLSALYKPSGAVLADTATDLATGAILSVGKGGTGANTFTAGRLMVGNGTSALQTYTGLTYTSGTTTLNTPIIAVSGTSTLTGNVGIGTAPSAVATTKLDVLGDVNIVGKTTQKGNIECLTLNPSAPTIPTALSIIPTPTSTFTPASTITRCAILTYQGVGTGTTYSVVIPAGGMLCDILMVGGGGHGGRDIGAGGGGGAVLYATNVLLKQDTYMMTVGRGAIFGSGEPRGQSTTGFGATLVGGGSAGDATWASAVYANDGGSGSGGKSIPDEWSKRGGRPIVGSSRKGGILTDGTLYEGNVGGYGIQQVSQVCSSGGGGAGAVGGNGGTSGGSGGTATGVGGMGISNTILDTAYYWGGGGGGGSYSYTTAVSGGLGGGGAGQNNNGGGITSTGSNGASSFFAVGTIINGINGTGGGGGGTGYTTSTAGSGGAGVIIIRYKLPTNHNQTKTYLPTGTNATITYKEGMIGANYKVEASLSSIVVDAFAVDAITATTSIKNSGLVVKSSTNDTLITNNCGIGIDPSSAYRLNVNGDLNVNGTIWNNGFTVNAGFQQYRTFNFTYSGDTNFLLTTRARYCNIICWVSSGSGMIITNGANMAVGEHRGSMVFSMTQSNATQYFFYWTPQGDASRPFKAWFGNGNNTTFTFIEMWYN